MLALSKTLLFASAALLCVAVGSAQSGDVGLPKKQPKDSLLGVPYVNAAAWAIADGKTGEFLWGQQQDKVTAMASITKVMTALVILDLAAKDETILAETVTVSRFASNTGGSSAKIRQGDRIRVSELLYGLLLPSGNDAANALAEHFGGRLAPPPDNKTVPWTPRSSGRSLVWANFVMEMNRRAKKLKMTKTRYVNPHGLDSEYHHSSARDILRLAKAAMAYPEFRARVGARRYRCKVIDGNGSRRVLDWTNTNRLLAIEGYIGLKTGTTTRAGSCLVSSAVRGDDKLLVVVLNSTNRQGRYVDSRNLYRWAFLQRIAGGK